jgi:hypothetical protein
MTTDPLQNAQKRAMQYWYVDGSFEFSFGGICLVLAAYFYAQFLLAESWISNLMIVFFLMVMLGGSFLINRLVMVMKERITFPRTGYISFPRKTGSRRWGRLLLVGVVSAAISVVMVLLLMNRPAGFDWTVAASGLLFGAVVTYLGFRTGAARFFINAALSIGLGLALGFANLPENIGLAAFYGLLGLGMLLVGGISLWQYLRQNQERKGEES